MKTPVANTNDPAVERNISRSDMDIVIAVSDKIPELIAVPAILSTIQVLEASIVDKASEIAANTLIVQNETPTIVSNAASALASKNAAELSEINASNSANSVSISKDNALASAVSANGSAQSALASKDSANLSAVSASASESVATTKASEASASATSASTSANTATTQAGIATTKANEASTSASNALTSETNADASEVMAHKWAQEAEDVIVTGTLGIDDEYSAYHWAQKAQAAVGGNITVDSLYDVDTAGIVDGGIITYNQSTGRYAPYDFRHNPYIGLNTTSGTIADVGQFTWNATEGTADLGLPNGVTLQLGQENNRLVRNNTASTILNGTVVVATGSLGASGRITVAPCGGTPNAVHAIYGVTTQDILAGDDGFITIEGKVRLINTSGSSVGETWNDGDVLYVKPNDNGRLTNVVPNIGELKVSIAKVIRAHATTGILEVRTLSVLDENAYEPRNTNIQTHIARIDNPHGVTKSQLGLGNVTNFDTTNASNITSGTLSSARLPLTGVSAGTYKSVTVDTTGRITAATNPTTIAGFGITDAYTKTELNKGQLDSRYYTESEVNAALDGVVKKVTSTDNAVVRFNGTTGEVQNSSVIIDDNGNVGIGDSAPQYKLSIRQSIPLPSTAGSKITAFSKHINVGNASFLMFDTVRTSAGSTHNSSEERIRKVVDAAEMGYIGFGNNNIKLGNDSGDKVIIDALGNVLLTSGNGGLGYSTGAGGTVTQLTSKATEVTLNKPSGIIIMNNAALAAGTLVYFKVFNSLFSANDTVTINFKGGGIDYTSYRLSLSSDGNAGYFYIHVENRTASSKSEAVQIKYEIIKGATS